MAANYNNDATEAYVKYANLFTMVNPQFAVDMLEKLLQLNPNSALAQRELANAYYNKGDYKKAAEEYGKYVTNPNHFKQDEDRYAFLLFYDGNYQKGYDYSTALLQANPANFTAQRYQFMNAAQIKEMNDKLLPMAEALFATHKASKDNKFAPIDYILIAQEFNSANRPQDAQAVLEEAIQDDPSNPEFYKQLAMTYVEENNLSKATDTYEGYLSHIENPATMISSSRQLSLSMPELRTKPKIPPLPKNTMALQRIMRRRLTRFFPTTISLSSLTAT